MLARPKERYSFKYSRNGRIFGVIPRKHGILEEDYIIHSTRNVKDLKEYK
jgi:hypothetical protein